MLTRFLSNFHFYPQHQILVIEKKTLPEGSDDNSLQKVAIKQNSHTDKSHCRSVSLHGGNRLSSRRADFELRKWHPFKISAGSEGKKAIL